MADLAHLYRDCRARRESRNTQPPPTWGDSFTLPVPTGQIFGGTDTLREFVSIFEWHC